jgi:hypothetical protein
MARILLVEDEPDVRDYVADVLEEEHDVLVAADGLEALTIIEDQKVRIDLLLTDIKMPGLNGIALARMAALRRHGLAVLYMTGFSEVALENVGRLLGGVLDKPFVPATLRRAVEQALTPSPPEGAVC